MSKPKLTWANFKRDTWLQIQLAIVISIATMYWIML